MATSPIRRPSAYATQATSPSVGFSMAGLLRRPAVADQNEGCPERRVRGRRVAEQLELGGAERRGAAEGLGACVGVEEAGGQDHGGLGGARPVGDQERPRAGVEKGARESRQALA